MSCRTEHSRRSAAGQGSSMDTHGVSKYTEYHPFSKITEHTLLKIYVLIIDPDITSFLHKKNY